MLHESRTVDARVARAASAASVRADSGAPRRRRILVLSPRDPHPPIGGDRLRIYRIARELARRYELTLLTFCRTARERDAPPPADGVFDTVKRIVLPTWRSCCNALTALPTRQPLQVAYYRSREFRRAVAALAPQHDAVLAHLVRTADYARELSCVRWLEMTDAISLGMRRVATTEAGYFDPRRVLYSVEARRLEAYERGIAAAFDGVTLTSDVDERHLFAPSGASHGHVMVVANGSDAPVELPPLQAQRRSGEIAFVGNLASLPNFDAAWFFGRHVLPRVRAVRPDAILRVIGPVKRLVARRLAALPGVRVEGTAPSLTTALATARIGVCPTRLGAGVQNKVLDYFGHRLAVVCSPIGLEGLDAHPGEHLLVAESPDEWAAQVLKLLNDELLSQRLADAGRELALARYRWERKLAPLLERLDTLLQSHPAPGGSAAEGAEAAPVMV